MCDNIFQCLPSGASWNLCLVGSLNNDNNNCNKDKVDWRYSFFLLFSIFLVFILRFFYAISLVPTIPDGRMVNIIVRWARRYSTVQCPWVAASVFYSIRISTHFCPLPSPRSEIDGMGRLGWSEGRWGVLCPEVVIGHAVPPTPSPRARLEPRTPTIR